MQSIWQLEDPSLIPDAITDLIGKSFTFGVYVEKDNVSYGAEIFKVGKVYKDRMICLTGGITSSHSEKPLTITSGDEVFCLIYCDIKFFFFFRVSVLT